MYILFTIQTYKANNFKTYILLQDSEISYITVRETKYKLLIRKCLVPKINLNTNEFCNDKVGLRVYTS